MSEPTVARVQARWSRAGLILIASGVALGVLVIVVGAAIRRAHRQPG